MVDLITDYFHTLFKSSPPNRDNINEVVDLVDPVVGSEMNDVLCALFTADEVRKAVFDMHPSKAPGPDGFTALYYQIFWPIIGTDVTQAVLSILNDQGDISDWNSTIITLIPKIREPYFLNDFCPISLCNTCYKIVARTITNRFRPILAQVIDPYQSAFIPG